MHRAWGQRTKRHANEAQGRARRVVARLASGLVWTSFSLCAAGMLLLLSAFASALWAAPAMAKPGVHRSLVASARVDDFVTDEDERVLEELGTAVED